MDPRSLVRRLASVALVGILAPLAFVDCASSNSGSSNPDGGVCPVSAPTSGTACFASDSTMCEYPREATPGGGAPGCYCCNGGGTPSYVCSKGTWQQSTYTAAGAPSMACPATPPKQGDGCQSGCGGAQQSCRYDCVTGNGRASNATCMNGSWNVAPLGLACPVDGGADASDAAAD